MIESYMSFHFSSGFRLGMEEISSWPMNGREFKELSS